MAEEMAELLLAAPYAILVTGVAPTERGVLTIHLTRALAELPPIKPGQTAEDRAQLSFTKVRINPKRANQGGDVTRYSRTNQALALHSDSSYSHDPHELVAFQMVRADQEGGESLIAPIDSLLAALDQETRDLLSKPIYPFGRGRQAVLWHSGNRANIRYYRSQIDSALAQCESLDEDASAALERVDEILARPEVAIRQRIQSGETLFIHNTRALHGRSAFAADSNRLMYRVRSHVGCLT